MRQMLGLLERLRQGARPVETPDPASLRFEMSQTDPDFAHVRDVQHDALGLIGASRSARQLKDRLDRLGVEADVIARAERAEDMPWAEP